MSKMNGIHLHLSSQLLLPQCDNVWIPLPDPATLTALTKYEAAMLRRYVGPQDEHNPRVLSSVAAPTWDAVIAEIRRALEVARMDEVRRVAQEEEYNAQMIKDAAKAAAEKVSQTEKVRALLPRILAGEGTLDSPTCAWICVAAGERIDLRDLDLDREPLHAEYRRREAAKEAAKVAEKAAKEAVIVDWIQAHGSARLRLAVEAGMTNNIHTAYRDERIATELGAGWMVWTAMPEPDSNERLNPTEGELRALLAARARWPQGSVRLRHVGGEDEEGITHWRPALLMDCPWNPDIDVACYVDSDE